MIAATIGHTFLNAWNAKYNKDYSAKEFFEKEYFPLFFDHPKYMLWVQNSPFVQMEGGQKVEKLTHEERLDKLSKLYSKIDSGCRDASIAIGFPASEEKEYATTSGLVSDLNLQVDADDVYLSWLGGSLGVGVAGGYSIYFDYPQILLSIYDGWKVYRKFLNDPTLFKLAGNKMNTWNGQWLNFAYSSLDFVVNPDFGYLSSCGFFKQNEEEIVVDSIIWTRLYFNLSECLSEEMITAFVFCLGQTNKTLGFIPFRFHQGRSMLTIYRILFGENEAIKEKKDYESLFGLDIGKACELGSLGIQALEPKGLREYFLNAKTPNYSTNPLDKKSGKSLIAFDERKQKAAQKQYENTIKFRTYKTWLLAMITHNKQEDLHYSEEIAKALKNYRAGARKNDRANLLENELLQAKTKRQFIDSLTSLINDVDKEHLTTFKTLRDKVHLMTAEDFGYFIVLLKFDYAYQEKKN